MNGDYYAFNFLISLHFYHKSSLDTLSVPDLGTMSVSTLGLTMGLYLHICQECETKSLVSGIMKPQHCKLL